MEDVINDMTKKISISAIFNSLSSNLSKATVCLGFTILIYMFLLYGSSMRKFDHHSIRFKIENQISKYLLIKLVLSFIAGSIAFVIYHLILHLPMAFIFTILFFLFNFIPHIVCQVMLTLPIAVPSWIFTSRVLLSQLVSPFLSFCLTHDMECPKF